MYRSLSRPGQQFEILVNNDGLNAVCMAAPAPVTPWLYLVGRSKDKEHQKPRKNVRGIFTK